jgi:polyisoprenoid-binding protein YceI
MSWKIDSAHTLASFTVRHMMISNVRGEFEKVTGAVDFNEENPTEATVDVQIDVASINTRDSQRDQHLKSPDFFNIELYPKISFKSKRVERTGDTSARLIGDLTIKDITREVSLDVDYAGLATSPWGATSAGFTATTKINRKDWDLNWNVALETGGWLVGEEIKINIDLEIIKETEAVLA